MQFDRLQGVIKNIRARVWTLELPNGQTKDIRLAKNVYLHPLSGLDEHNLIADLKGVEDIPKGARVIVSGQVYTNDPIVLAKEVTVLGLDEEALLIERPDWWSSQARSLADFWIRAYFHDGDIADPSNYRTVINKIGSPRPELVNLQETATLSRLIYGLSSTYIITGNQRVLRAASEFVRFQRERMRIESADGKHVYWLHARRGGCELTINLRRVSRDLIQTPSPVWPR
ncbi:hypothetical protein C3Y92_13890 [Solidesulfovibrio carbinolicus]|uniref:Uncharacterized protein n=1 Tax=Solidesulfovibrio carbinolicus TaxID=296842 RepID=A0A4P6HM17_9BACT|nr:hypothetical protein C3Y92_13890 [Solidesulfovibrio carbinolicus]